MGLGASTALLRVFDCHPEPEEDSRNDCREGCLCDTYQRGLDKIAAAAAKHGIAAGMYFIPPGMDPNFFVQKGFRFFTMPWAPWAQAGIKNALAGIKR